MTTLSASLVWSCAGRIGDRLDRESAADLLSTWGSRPAGEIDGAEMRLTASGLMLSRRNGSVAETYRSGRARVLHQFAKA